MAIYLVRHGETGSNRDRIVQTPDTPLSTRGLAQAEQLAAAFANLTVSKVISSDYTRTQQTARPVAQLKDCEVELSPLLRERSFGDLRGKSYKEIGADFFASDYHPPNGESVQQFSVRVRTAWQYIMKTSDDIDGSLVVMTHGLVLRELVSSHLLVTDETKGLSDFQNTSITEVENSHNKMVLRLCDATHLLSNNELGGII